MSAEKARSILARQFRESWAWEFPAPEEAQYETVVVQRSLQCADSVLEDLEAARLDESGAQSELVEWTPKLSAGELAHLDQLRKEIGPQIERAVGDEPTDAMIEDALETARQRALVLFQAYARGVASVHGRSESQFMHDVETFNSELVDALRVPVSRSMRKAETKATQKEAG